MSNTKKFYAGLQIIHDHLTASYINLQENRIPPEEPQKGERNPQPIYMYIKGLKMR